MKIAAGLLATLALLMSTGCSTRSEKLLASQVEELERAHASGKVTTAEYLKMKHELQNKAADRDAGLGKWD